MHQGFIPVLPHCIGKCNSLAGGFGLVVGDRKTWREGGSAGRAGQSPLETPDSSNSTELKLISNSN